jgi:protein O-mannosyl-transferase
MLVTIPFVLLLLDCWPLNRFKNTKSIPTLVFEKIPFFAVSILASAVTFISQKHAGSVVALENFPLSDRLANAIVSYARYLSKTFVPINLCAYYPQEQWQLWQVAGSLVLVSGLTILALASFRRRPYLFVGWFWFLGMLVPVIGFAQVGFQSMADRYTYLPHIGLFIAVVWGAAEIGRKPALVVVTLAAVVSAALTLQQVSYWRDSEVLFERTLRLTKNNVSGEYFMALAYESEGQKEKSIPHFIEAIRGNPDNIKAITHLGRIYAGMGKLDDAKAQFEAALRIDSDLPLTHMNFADVLLRQGKRDEAIDHFIAAMQLNPGIPEAHYELSNLLSAKHDFGGAIDHLKTAIQLKPDWPIALNSLAWTLATQQNAQWRNGADAIRYAEQAATLTKNSDPGILDTLAAAYAEVGRFPDAIRTAETAIQVAQTSGQSNLINDFSSHLKLYRSGTPYRE